MALMRLQKFLAQAGVCSRRQAENFILAGRVAVNGTAVATLGSKVDPENDAVCLDGKPVSLALENIYIMLHKPRGFVTSRVQPQERTVLELVEIPRRLNPVGRLDKDSTGLLLLTTDGGLHNRLTHPSFDHEKEYVVAVEHPISDQNLARLAKGVMLEDGPTRRARVRRLTDKGFSIVLKEGRNRQIRRMVEKLGNRVASLHRIRVSTLCLGNLAEGRWRHLTADEVAKLKALG